MLRACLLTLILVLPSSCAASDWYTDPLKGHEGWYGYQVYGENGTKTQKEVREKPLLGQYWPSRKETMGMNATALGVLIRKATDLAVQDPDQENVKRWVEYMDIARLKSLRFANVVTWVRQNNPQYNTLVQAPLTYTGRLVAYRARSRHMKEYIRRHSRDFAILLFVSDQVPLSRPAQKILSEFCNERGWILKIYDIRRNQAIAKSIGVNAVPQAWVVSRKGFKPFPVMTGAVSKDQVELALYRGLKIVTGEARPEDYAAPLPVTSISQGGF